jgi:hypothetical protein
MKLALFRPEDLLVLEFELVNLKLSADGTVLVQEDDAADAFVVVHFPPQALAEAVWAGAVPDAPPIRTVLAGPTRLVFRVTDGSSLPLTARGLLTWDTWEPVLAPTALPRDTAPDPTIPLPAIPAALETAVEFPWRLVLSPDALGRWRTDNGSSAISPHQLWSAVLRTTDGGNPAEAVRRGTAAGADVRALAEYTGPKPFETSLDGFADTRRQIVQLSSNFHLPIAAAAGATPFTPVPLRAKRLELTALGANAELEASWDYPLLAPENQPPGFDPLDLVRYRHTAALGRDHFVQTVTVGYLCGTGHRAVVEITVERLPNGIEQLGQAPGGGALFSAKGYLLQTAQVIVQQPVVDYDELAAAFAHGGRELPLRSIRITTKSARISLPPEEGAFWLLDPNGRKLMFHAVGTDVAGNAVEFSLPLMFVRYKSIGDHRLIRAVFDQFADASVIELAGQVMTFAPPGDKPGSTVLKTGSADYDIEQPLNPANPHPEHAMNAAGAPASYVPRFLPRIASILASAPAVDDLLGSSRQQELVPDPAYLEHGFDPAGNRAQTFVSFVQDLPLALPTQRGGGLASPASVAQALSRNLGPVSAPDQLQLGKVDLSAFANTKFLGTIPLLDLLPVNLNFDAAASGSPISQQQLDDPNFTVNPPRLTTRRLPEGAAVPAVVETRFLWKPELRQTHDVSSVFTLDLANADLLLDARTRLVHGGEASSVVIGRLRNAKLTFADALGAEIGTLFFRAESGRKLDVGATNVRITFQGPLAFVNSLQSILPSNGFDDPPSLVVDSQGAVAGYTLGIPSIGVGIFSIQNIGLSAALSIPFTDRPAGVRFAISERHKPFLVTVSLFGGGGFFAVGVSAKGLEQVEASLEFGGNVSLNLGVASGGVYVMAGIYFGMTGTSVELTGYLRCGGYLEVLGLISISLEFYLAFTYRKKSGQGSEVWGQASLTVSVKIAFFSTSVSLAVERHFAGADGDPTFAESITAPEWAGYLQAFA